MPVDYKRIYDRVMRQLRMQHNKLLFDRIDITNFKFEDYKDELLLICYLHAMDSTGEVPYTHDDVKRFVIGYREYTNECKNAKCCVFST